MEGLRFRTYLAARAASVAGFMGLVCACIVSKRVETPDGREAWHVDCPDDPPLCMDEAEWRCPLGYLIISQGEAPVASVQTPASTGPTAAPPSVRGNLTIQCRDDAEPQFRTSVPLAPSPTPLSVPAASFFR
jgi:hypothetical protein